MGFRKRQTTRGTSVPKAAMDEDGYALGTKSQIGTARGGDGVSSIAGHMRLAKGSSQSDLRACVRGAVRSHDRARSQRRWRRIPGVCRD